MAYDQPDGKKKLSIEIELENPFKNCPEKKLGIGIVQFVRNEYERGSTAHTVRDNMQ